MKKSLTIFSIITTLLLAVVATAVAQSQYGQIDARTVEAELERTDQVIQQAREMVAASKSLKARYAWDNAVTLQKAAWVRFREGTQTSLRQAYTLTRQAREKAKYALANGMFTEQNEDVVQRRLEKVEQVLQRARELIGPNGNANMRAIYDSAEDNLRRAWEFYRVGQQRPALKLCNQVENTLRKIINAANRQQRGEASFERRAEEVRETIEHVRQRIAECDSEMAGKLLEQAENSLQQAYRFAGESRQAAAGQTLQNARRLANQAMKECGGYGDLSVPSEKLVSEANRISQLVTPDNEQAQHLLQQVYEQLELAQGLIADEEVEAALAALKAARLSLNQLKRLLGVSRP
ncbi:MAG: hypothetical protein KAU36_10230 [candidate division Zixibacteria bacterium]|nr:hypothetical protein [candidate division Zixibacteria bacterium]